MNQAGPAVAISHEVRSPTTIFCRSGLQPRSEGVPHLLLAQVGGATTVVLTSHPASLRYDVARRSLVGGGAVSRAEPAEAIRVVFFSLRVDRTPARCGGEDTLWWANSLLNTLRLTADPRKLASSPHQ
jgi:hypothetical protein